MKLVLLLGCLLSLALLLPFGKKTTFATGTQAWRIDISDDGSILVVCVTDSASVGVYHYDSSIADYQFAYNLTDNSYKCYHVDITPDGQWIYSVDYDSEGHIYKYNSGSGVF